MTEILLATIFLSLLLVVLAVMLHAVREYLLPARPVTVTVNGARSLAASANTKLLDILNANGIPVPSGCAGAGTCGLCRVNDVSGAGGVLPTEKARLTAADLREGVRLACQVIVRGDTGVRVPEDILSTRTLRCRVAATRSVTPLIKEIVLDVPPDERFEFRAGSFVQVNAPPYALDFAAIEIADAHRVHWDKLGLGRLRSESAVPVSRAYSVASRPQEAGRIVLNIRLATPPPAVPHAPPGVVSSWLFGLKAGEDIEIAGPYGDFAVQDTGREMVFIGGGVGMAPLRAMIFDQLERLRTTRRISFWYGARSKGELFYIDEFDDLARRHPNFTWTPALSEPLPGDGWTGASGFVHDVVFNAYLRDHPAPEDCEYYLCGPPLMIEAVYAMLDQCGVGSDSIFNDDFGI